MWRKVKQEKEETASKPLSSKGSDARESKGTPAKAWVSKGNPEQAPESFARSLCSLASLAPRVGPLQQSPLQQKTIKNKKILKTTKNSKTIKNRKNSRKERKKQQKATNSSKNLQKRIETAPNSAHKAKQEREETASTPLSRQGSDARESKGTPTKAWVSKTNPEQAPEQECFANAYKLHRQGVSV